jgi:hypothetical protein
MIGELLTAVEFRGEGVHPCGAAPQPAARPRCHARSAPPARSTRLLARLPEPGLPTPQPDPHGSASAPSPASPPSRWPPPKCSLFHGAAGAHDAHRPPAGAFRMLVPHISNLTGLTQLAIDVPTGWQPACNATLLGRPHPPHHIGCVPKVADSRRSLSGPGGKIVDQAGCIDFTILREFDGQAITLVVCCVTNWVGAATHGFGDCEVLLLAHLHYRHSSGMLRHELGRSSNPWLW